MGEEEESADASEPTGESADQDDSNGHKKRKTPGGESKQQSRRRRKTESKGAQLGLAYLPAALPHPVLEQHLLQPADSLLMAMDTELNPLLFYLLSLLAPSSPFAVYSPSIEPLAECLRIMRGQQLVCNTMLSETWFREYQILPNRTHPDMNMSGASGFLLTGTTVAQPVSAEAFPQTELTPEEKQIMSEGDRRQGKPKRERR
eukprot:TRINITY_DN16214_c0_g1_i16.p1 TRINITY_DN16214_c0_g1~~TRINITY_DN16214_c0_g1_i16.p1  ORF type:complete len:212 (-),score=67.08 TRINITY_DN16214_c0_g1_i16:106-714(-)